MSSGTKQVRVATVVSTDGREKDINRPPDSSDEDEENLADLPRTSFTSGSDAPAPQTDLQRRRQASIAKQYEKNGVPLPCNLNDSTHPKTRRGYNSPSSNQASSGSKRKVRDDGSESNKLGRGMADVFGTITGKKAKNQKTFSSKAKIEKMPPYKFKTPALPSSDVDESPRRSLAITERKFKKPDLMDSPPRSNVGVANNFITKSNMDTTPQKPDVDAIRAFKVPLIDFDGSFHSSDSDLGATGSCSTRDETESNPRIPRKHDKNLFRNYGLEPDEGLSEGAHGIIAADLTVGGDLSRAESGPMHDVGHNNFLNITQNARCPMCNESVDPDDLRALGPMNTRKQEKFCVSHRRKSAEVTWKSQGYPEIDWEKLDSRISQHHSFIEKLIRGEDSHYRKIMSEKINAGQDRTLRTTTTNLIPGYYGSRGLKIMSENIMHKFSHLVKVQIIKDRLMSSRGFTPYVQAVLVPEVAVLLIMEDMSVSIEEARHIFNESASIGELLNEEIREIVRNQDVDTEDDDE